jgi:hypothetical protein
LPNKNAADFVACRSTYRRNAPGLAPLAPILILCRFARKAIVRSLSIFPNVFASAVLTAWLLESPTVQQSAPAVDLR